MKKWIGILFLISCLAVIAGCGGSDEPAVAAASQDGGNGAVGNNGGRGGNGYQSDVLNNDYDGALNIQMQFVIGIFRLENSTDALTAEQAKTMLTFWQALQGGTITNATERNAVMKQIEGAFSESQLDAIADMKLTFEDLSDWAEANGIELPQFGGQGGGAGVGPGGGGQGGARGAAFAQLSEEDRAALRDMTQEERRARLAELGIEVPEGGRQGGGQGGGEQGERQPGGRFGAVTEALVELLAEREAE